VLLVRARGRVLTTHELLDVVWRGTSVLDNTVTQRIREIREALGDEARNSRYVRTISRVGYRFVGEVTSEPRTPGAIVDPPTLNGALADDLTERFSRALIERILSELILRRRAESLTADDSLIEPNHRIEHRRHPGRQAPPARRRPALQDSGLRTRDQRSAIRDSISRHRAPSRSSSAHEQR
jgi:hypothetical protein